MFHLTHKIVLSNFMFIFWCREKYMFILTRISSSLHLYVFIWLSCGRCVKQRWFIWGLLDEINEFKKHLTFVCFMTFCSYQVLYGSMWLLKEIKPMCGFMSVYFGPDSLYFVHLSQVYLARGQTVLRPPLLTGSACRRPQRQPTLHPLTTAGTAPLLLPRQPAKLQRYDRARLSLKLKWTPSVSIFITLHLLFRPAKPKCRTSRPRRLSPARTRRAQSPGRFPRRPDQWSTAC